MYINKKRIREILEEGHESNGYKIAVTNKEIIKRGVREVSIREEVISNIIINRGGILKG